MAATAGDRKSLGNGPPVLPLQLYYTVPEVRCPSFLLVQPRSFRARFAWNAVPRKLFFTPAVRMRPRSFGEYKKRISPALAGRYMRALWMSVTASGDGSCAERRRENESRQRKHRPFREIDVSDRNLFLGLRLGATHSGDSSPSGVRHSRRDSQEKVLWTFQLYPVGGWGRVKTRQLGFGYQEELGTVPYMEVVVARAVRQTALWFWVPAATDAV